MSDNQTKSILNIIFNISLPSISEIRDNEEEYVANYVKYVRKKKDEYLKGVMQSATEKITSVSHPSESLSFSKDDQVRTSSSIMSLIPSSPNRVAIPSLIATEASSFTTSSSNVQNDNRAPCEINQDQSCAEKDVSIHTNHSAISFNLITSNPTSTGSFVNNNNMSIDNLVSMIKNNIQERGSTPASDTFYGTGSSLPFATNTVVVGNKGSKLDKLSKSQKKRAKRNAQNRLLKVQQMNCTPDAKMKFNPSNPCRYFLRGACVEGNKCRFKHDIIQESSSPSSKSVEPCLFIHLYGTCDNENDCQYSHTLLDDNKRAHLRIKAGPCRYHHFRGTCKSGDQCLFSHDPIGEDEKNKLIQCLPLCTDYHLQGVCHKEDKCIYLHDEASFDRIQNLKQEQISN
ncbi:MAG: hypothetical protein EXX96DRAFT_582046 [Benjaminiella poitrasii]|nr:MAG: hypothetical protein EXX96DRAFT_582046 [Benjaminiella poitrasii]